MNEDEQVSRLEALGIENQLLQHQLAQTQKERKLEAENSKLRERIARQQLREKVSSRNILAQIISRSPKPIARVILWLGYAAPFFFVLNTITWSDLATGKSSSYAILLDVLKAIRPGNAEGANMLIGAVAMQAQSFKTFSGFMAALFIWLSYATLKWYYNGAPSSSNFLARLSQNPLVALSAFSACRLNFALSESTHNFYAALQSLNDERIASILNTLDISSDLHSYFSYTITNILRVACWTFVTICLNKEVQRTASPQSAEIQNHQ
jgi:hypothetical protein